MVALGTTVSRRSGILAAKQLDANAGPDFEVVNGQFFPTNWLDVIFKPVFPIAFRTRYCLFNHHGVPRCSASPPILIERDRFVEEGRVMLSMTLWLLTVLVPLPDLRGRSQGLNTPRSSPAKLARSKRFGTRDRHLPLTLFRYSRRTGGDEPVCHRCPGDWELDPDPRHQWRGEGLKDFPAEERPPVAVPFFAFRIMVGCAAGDARHRGGGRLAALASAPLRFPGFSDGDQYAMPLGFLAVIAGWVTAEVGRQPWTVYGRCARPIGDAVADGVWMSPSR
jgi:cytochrome d ubiquinol oxidase subunit I